MCRSANASRTSTIAVACLLALALAACTNTATNTASDTATNTELTQTSTTFRDEPDVDERLPAGYDELSLEEKIDDFLVAPNSGKSANIASSMQQTGELRWVPWLLDLHRLGQSTRTDRFAIAALADLSGIDAVGQRTEDFQVYGQWAQSQNISGGAGYRAWKLGLYGMIDPEFEALLGRVDDDQLLTEIHWGGVTRGGIPELNNPERLPVGEADWMTDDELVLGAEIDGVAVAYPVRILGHHELANDEIAGVPVSMVYCTLCRTGLLFDRRLPGTAAGSGEDVLDFQTSGLLFSSNKIMVDSPSDTYWHHLSGTGFAGPHDGVVLDQYPVVTTTWADWVAAHPESETLRIPDPIFFPETPERPPIAYTYDPGGAYQHYYANPDVWFPIFDTPDVFPLKTSVVGIDRDNDQLAVNVEALAEVGSRVFAVGDSLVLLVPTSTTTWAGARAYDATGSGLADGSQPVAVAANESAATLEDGAELPRVTVAQSFWFAWFGDHQQTRTWPE